MTGPLPAAKQRPLQQEASPWTRALACLLTRSAPTVFLFVDRSRSPESKPGNSLLVGLPAYQARGYTTICVSGPLPRWIKHRNIPKYSAGSGIITAHHTTLHFRSFQKMHRPSCPIFSMKSLGGVTPRFCTFLVLSTSSKHAIITAYQCRQQR